jgi:hypothetical protein
MPVDVSALSPESREHYLQLGRRETSHNTLAQANKTIGAFAHWGAQVTEDGYGPEDDAHLSDTRDTLLDRFTDGSNARGATKVATVDLVMARRDARGDRRSARSLLSSCVPPLRDRGNVQDARRVQSLLEQTSSVEHDTALIDQLTRMHDIISEPVLVPLMAGRGGPGLIVRIQRSRENLVAALRERAGHTGGTALANERDILDGIIITLTRNAARAARAASRRLGLPAIAQDFKLVYFRSGGASATDDGAEPTPPEPATDPTPASA